MTKHAVLFWNLKHTKLLQVFGPYNYESDAEAAIERLNEWPSLTDGIFEIVKLYGDPETGQPAYTPITPIPYYPGVWNNPTITWNVSNSAPITPSVTYQLSM
jgi:hypothetical protein